MKIKARIILWFIILVISLDITNGLVSLIRTKNNLYHILTNRLKAESRKINCLISNLVKEEGKNFSFQNLKVISNIFNAEAKNQSNETFLQISDDKDNIILKSENLLTVKLPIDKNETMKEIEIIIEKPIKVLCYSSQIYIPNSKINLQVAIPITQIQESINILIENEIIEGLTSLIISIFFGLFFSAKILKPISNIIEQVENITPEDFNKRIDTSNLTKDEIGKIAEALNKMLEKNSEFNKNQIRFIADASHELRSPLTSILGNAQLLSKRGVANPEIIVKTSNNIIKDSERLINLMNDLIYLFQINSGNLIKEKFDINQLLNEMVSDLQNLNSEISFISDGNPIYIFGSLESIKKVLNNLIHNALFALNKTNNTINISSEVKENTIEITIKDNGSGIPENSINKVFDRFYKVDSSRKKNKKGSGLGLSIAYEIIKIHNGKISIESSVDAGSTFKITLPTI